MNSPRSKSAGAESILGIDLISVYFHFLDFVRDFKHWWVICLLLWIHAANVSWSLEIIYILLHLLALGSPFPSLFIYFRWDPLEMLNKSKYEYSKGFIKYHLRGNILWEKVWLSAKDLTFAYVHIHDDEPTTNDILFSLVKLHLKRSMKSLFDKGSQ